MEQGIEVVPRADQHGCGDRGLRLLRAAPRRSPLRGCLKAGCLAPLGCTVITREGSQEGSAKGYNPNRKGRNSHHPLIAFISQTRMVANAWLRPGN